MSSLRIAISIVMWSVILLCGVAVLGGLVSSLHIAWPIVVGIAAMQCGMIGNGIILGRASTVLTAEQKEQVFWAGQKRAVILMTLPISLVILVLLLEVVGLLRYMGSTISSFLL